MASVCTCWARVLPVAGWCIGTIAAFNKPWYLIKYTDGDKEELARERALALIKRYENEEGQE